MPTQQIPAAPVVGGVTSLRHAKLLHHLFEGNNGGGGALVKDLRIRRVVPPPSAPPFDASPDPAAKPVPAAVHIQLVQSTPPEPSAAAAVEGRERKPVSNPTDIQMLPRSKLVRDPGSFGYRRLLPFLNQMATKNGSDVSDGKDTHSDTMVSVSANKELCRSDPGLVDESVDGSGSQGGAVPVVDPVVPVVVEGEGDRETQDCCDNVNEEPKVVSADPASSKPCVTRCTRSKFVHHPSSFNYKRMLPFLMENEISSEEVDRAKIRRVSEEEQIAPEGSPEELDRPQVDRVVEEMTSMSDGNCVGQIQSAVTDVSLDGSSTGEVQRDIQEVQASVGDPLSSEKGELTSDTSGVLAEVERIVEGKESQSDEKSVLMDSVEPLVAKAGGDQELNTEETKIVSGDIASSKPCLARCMRSRFVPHLSSFSYKRMLPFLMENNISSQEGGAKLQEVPEEKQLASGESDDVLTSTAETQKVTPEVVSSSDRQCQLAVSESLPEESNVAEAERIIVNENTTNSDMNAVDLQSAVSEVSAQVCDTAEMQLIQKQVLTSNGDRASDSKLVQYKAELDEVQQSQSSESGCPNVGFGSPTNTDQHGVLERHDSVACPDGLMLDVGMICKPSLTSVSCLKKQVLSPKKLSPKKGILKRHTSWGCKGICMCLDCSVFRLRADRAFEFSRKQMQEADDIIGNLLEEVASLRSVVGQSSGQQEQIKEACQRASRVEEVARERQRQMLAELNSHCKIPGPKVKFAQYVDEKMPSSPCCTSSSGSRSQPPL